MFYFLRCLPGRLSRQWRNHHSLCSRFLHSCSGRCLLSWRTNNSDNADDTNNSYDKPNDFTDNFTNDFTDNFTNDFTDNITYNKPYDVSDDNRWLYRSQYPIYL